MQTIEQQLAAELNKTTKSAACSIFMGVPLETTQKAWADSRVNIRAHLGGLNLAELNRVAYVIKELQEQAEVENDIIIKKAVCAAMVRTRFVDEFQGVMTWDEFLEALSC